MSDISLKGLKEIDDFLTALPVNMQKGAYRAALTAAANPIRDEARARAPKGKTGKMVRAIRSGSPRQNEDGNFSITVSLKGNDHSFIGLFAEYGVKPHLIGSTKGKIGRASLKKAAASGDSSAFRGPMKIGDDFVSGAIHHPGSIAKPFLRPALDIKAQVATEVFAQRIRDYIEGKTGFAAPEAD